jgi:hypothetical protein
MVLPLRVAVRVSVPDLVELAITVKLTCFAPPAIVTVEGSVTRGLLPLTGITRPPIGAAEEIAKVTLAVFPSGTEFGDAVKLDKVGARTVRVADALPPGHIPVTVAVVSLATGVVGTENDEVVWPTGTVTEAGASTHP